MDDASSWPVLTVSIEVVEDRCPDRRNKVRYIDQDHYESRCALAKGLDMTRLSKDWAFPLEERLFASAVRPT